MADMLMLTLGLFGGIASYLANPCGPEQWALVKAARNTSESIPTSSRGTGRIAEPAPAPAALLDGDFASMPA
jgi:hypothetical protein